MAKTKIEWSQFSWNPVTGCTPCSLGCTHCYAERMARRLAGRYGYPEAPHHFDVTLRPERLDEPLRRKKPTIYFVCSMSDLFHEDVPFPFISEIFQIMGRMKQHTFQILTKRPTRMLKWQVWGGWRLPNVWLGVSIENQAAADERREYLEQCPAAIKYVSYEPALGPVDWTGWEFVSQIISGGESGPGARPSHPDWHRATRDFCQEHNIAYFMKQHGAWLHRSQLGGKAGFPGATDMHCWTSNLDASYRVGKKRAGHLLDGRAWQEFPRIKGDI